MLSKGAAFPLLYLCFAVMFLFAAPLDLDDMCDPLIDSQLELDVSVASVESEALTPSSGGFETVDFSTNSPMRSDITCASSKEESAGAWFCCCLCRMLTGGEENDEPEDCFVD